MNQKKPVLTLANILLHHSTRVQEIDMQLRALREKACQDPVLIAYLQGQLDALQAWVTSIQVEFRYDPAIWQ